MLFCLTQSFSFRRENVHHRGYNFRSAGFELDHRDLRRPDGGHLYRLSQARRRPIYRLYRETLGLTPFAITFIFAVYSFTMIGAFLTIARLSDYVGRKPMIWLALGLNAFALLLFFIAKSAEMLALARAVQGVATGVALATLGAVIADAAPQWAATLNSMTAFVGLALGALISGAFIAFAPWPTHLVYAVLLGVTLAEMVILGWIAETTSRKAGAWSGIRPKLTVPAAAAVPMARLFPLTLSAWALGGFCLSLMPSLVIEATGFARLSLAPPSSRR